MRNATVIDQIKMLSGLKNAIRLAWVLAENGYRKIYEARVKGRNKMGRW